MAEAQVFVCICEQVSEVPRSASMRLCGAGDTSLPPSVLGKLAAGALRRAEAAYCPAKGVAASGAAASSPQVKVHLMARLAHTGPGWGCI